MLLCAVVLAVVLVFCLASMGGYMSDPLPEEEIAPAEVVALAGLSEILLTGAGAVTLRDGNNFDYDVMWGPAHGRACAGEIDLVAGVINLTSGYVYIAAGKLPNSTAPIGVPWPLVVTSHIEVAADGTVLMVETDVGEERAYRLDPTRSSTVSARVPGGAWVSTADTAVDKVMEWTSGTSAVGAPASLSTAQRTLRDDVVNIASLRGIRVPV